MSFPPAQSLQKRVWWRQGESVTVTGIATAIGGDSKDWGRVWGLLCKAAQKPLVGAVGVLGAVETASRSVMDE